MKHRGRALAPSLSIGALVLWAASAVAQDSERDRLRFIVQQQCLPHWLQVHDPAPCISVATAGGGSSPAGFAVLADRKGGAHFLLIPTQTISGIESPGVRSSAALNYFDAAWQARDVLATAVGHTVPREAVGMAVNQLRARSQDQLHIHISCLRQSVYDALQAGAERIGPTWSAFSIAGWHYQALRIMGQQLAPANPFELLADRLPGARQAMEQFTVLVAGMRFKEGSGFVVLAGSAVPGAELLLDSGCTVAR
jgi:CDP-diacylglycerol pyrophosphatase